MTSRGETIGNIHPEMSFSEEEARDNFRTILDLRKQLQKTQVNNGPPTILKTCSKTFENHVRKH